MSVEKGAEMFRRQQRPPSVEAARDREWTLEDLAGSALARGEAKVAAESGNASARRALEQHEATVASGDAP